MSKSVDTKLGSNKVFSDNLKRQLALTGKTQKEVAAAIGVTGATFCDWINLRSYPRMDKIQKLADYFGISKTDLVEDEYITKDMISGKEQRLLALFRQVPAKHQEYVIDLVEFHVKNLR